MLLALLSDTHDNVATTQAALALLKPHGVAAYLHAGDMVAPSTLDLFKGLPFHFVFGNNEYDHAALRSRAAVLGLKCHGQVGELIWGGKGVVLMHGHETTPMRRALASQASYVVHGHTHVRRDERVGGTRVINPGALHRARVKSVALLDIERDILEFLTLDAGG